MEGRACSQQVLRLRSAAMKSYDPREKLFERDDALSADGQGMVYQAVFNSVQNEQRRMNLYIYSTSQGSLTHQPQHVV